MENETTPLLQHNPSPDINTARDLNAEPDLKTARNLHQQFCALTGVPSSSLQNQSQQHHHKQVTSPTTLYGRAVHRHAKARRSHAFITAMSNTLLLSQMVLGTVLIALGASSSSYILITVFSIVNTIITGVVAYLKTQGQPDRQRVLCNDLERVVDEMKHSETMWLGIAEGIHGYNEINIDNTVTVRSEVARLTRCYDKAVNNHAVSNPDYYMSQAECATALHPCGVLPVALRSTSLPASLAPAQTLGMPAALIPDSNESPGSAQPQPDHEERYRADPGEAEDEEREHAGKLKKRPFIKGHRISRSIFNGTMVDDEGKDKSRHLI